MEQLNQWLWRLLPALLTAAALFCGIRLRGEPVRGFRFVLRDTFGSLLRRSEGKAQRGVFAAALAATMGTGNLAGTALALCAGGAGAVFWMWVSALLGMFLVCAENRLSARFSGNGLGGALAYLRRGLRHRFPADLFAVCCIGSAFGMGNMVQSNTIAQTAAQWAIPAPVCGCLTALLFGLLLAGGVNRLRNFASYLMPLLCGIYLLGCGILLIKNHAALSAAFCAILRGAFGLRAAGGGFAASVFLRSLCEGIKRGIFSNEAGLGSSGLLHMDGCGSVPQWKWAASEVFADTVLGCTATALVILTAPGCTLSGNAAELLLKAFSGGLGSLAGGFLGLNMILLAFATMVGWYPCGLAAFRYLTNGRGEGIYRACCLLAAFSGALGNPAWLWTFCDLCNALTALPNLYGLVVLPLPKDVDDSTICK